MLASCSLRDTRVRAIMVLAFSDIVEQIRLLDDGSKQALLDLLRSWLREERREQIARNARESREEYASGEARSGSLNDMMTDLYAEDRETDVER